MQLKTRYLITSNLSPSWILNFFASLFIYFSSGLLSAQQDLDNLLNVLTSQGLENVKAITEGPQVFLAYENNRYRFEADALAFVLDAFEFPKGTQKATMLIQNRGIGIVKLSFLKTDFDAYKKGELSGEAFASLLNFSWDVEQVEQKLEKQPVSNSSFYKADFIVGVDLDYFIGDFTNSIRQKVNLQPAFSTVLGKGTELLGIYNMPYFNEIDEDNYNNLRLGRISQDLRLKDNQFLNFSVGYFSSERFGFHARYNKLLFEERLRLGMDFGLTRFGFLKDDFKVNTNYLILYPLMTGGLTYRWIKYNTDISFRYGIFSKQDLGYKFAYTRQMGLTYIGLFLNKTSFGETVGFHFQAPIGFKKHLKPNRLRVRTKENFPFVYTYDGGAEIANEYYTGDNVISQLSEYYPSVLKSALKRIL